MLFQKLLKENSQIWDSYLHHDFVKQLENGTLKSE
ncbi:TPA: thiaminase II, partial [Campylobacter upsaliensis]|nr:thiaminase II [Campylobacter upsaliensis]HEF3557871.1 thiaminase II [Campylobacter upsaliensis]